MTLAVRMLQSVSNTMMRKTPLLRAIPMNWFCALQPMTGVKPYGLDFTMTRKLSLVGPVSPTDSEQ